MPPDPGAVLDEAADVTIRLRATTEPERPMIFKFEFSHYGDPIEIEVPPDEETISVEDRLAELMGE